jgi:HD-like signal output (HDOD) protein
MELVDSPRTSARSLARLIEGDQVLTAKILKLANSAYYGFQRQIATVPLAVIVVGFEAVKDMGLSVSVVDAFPGGVDTPHFDLSRFWEHAISVGVGSQMLARRYCPEHLSESFASGLMHDLGKVVLNHYLHEDFVEILERVHDDDMDLLEAESVVLDATHDRIGGWLAEKWCMPYPIVKAIEYHHHPFLADKFQLLAALVKLADYFSRLWKIGESGNKKEPALTAEDLAFYATLKIDLSDEALAALREDFLTNVEQSGAFINIVRGIEELPPPA